MRPEPKRTDISHLPDLLRLAEAVERSGKPQMLARGDQPVAMLVPARNWTVLREGA